MEPGLYEWVISGQGLIEQIQRWYTPLLDFYFLFMTFLGNEEFFLIVLPAIYWCIDKTMGRRLLYLLIFSNFLNELLKNSFRLPRPPEILHRVQEGGFGLPSGHAMNALTLWGYTTWRLRQMGIWIWIISIVVVLSTTVSRLYLGVHYPADALMGLVFGVLTLLLYLWIERQAVLWLPRAERQLFIPVAAILSLILLFVLPGDTLAYPGETAITLSGLFFGASVGFYYEVENVRFSIQGSAIQRLLRYGVGAVITLLFWLGLRVLFGLVEAPFWLESFLRFVRYALTGVAVTGWSPAIFVQLGLAEREAGVLVESPVVHTVGGVK